MTFTYVEKYGQLFKQQVGSNPRPIVSDRISCV